MEYARVGAQNSDIYRIHRYQFVLGHGAVYANASWQCRQLKNGWQLSHCPDLPVYLTIDQDGQEWCLLGLAVQCGQGRDDPIEEISTNRSADVPALSATWAGRWLLIGESALYPDNGAFLQVFIRTVQPIEIRDLQEAETEQSWLSSSLNLLATIPQLTPLQPLHGPDLEHEWGLDFHVPPNTAYAEIRRLLPSQWYRYSDDTLFADTRLFALLEYANRSQSSAADLLNSLSDLLVTGFRNFAAGPARGYNLWASLSAGYDSRCNLAAAVVAGLPIRIYTQFYPGKTPDADKQVPLDIAHILGLEHRLIVAGPEKVGMRQRIAGHCAGDVVSGDGENIVRGLWDDFSKRDFLIRGVTYCGIKSNYGEKFDPDWINSPAPDLAVRVSDAFGGLDSEWQLRRITTLLSWIQETAHPLIDWRDRFALDARLGGSAAAKEYELDGLAAPRFEISNCHAISAVFLSFPAQYRLSNRIQFDLITRLLPEIAEVPFNPAENIIVRTQKNVSKAARITAKRGLWQAAKWGTNALKQKLG